MEDIKIHAKWELVHPLQKDDCGAYMCSNCKNGDWDLKGDEKECPFCHAIMELLH